MTQSTNRENIVTFSSLSEKKEAQPINSDVYGISSIVEDVLSDKPIRRFDGRTERDVKNDGLYSKQSLSKISAINDASSGVPVADAPTPLPKTDQEKTGDDEDPTLGDYALSVASGAADVGSNIAGGVTYLYESVFGDEGSSDNAVSRGIDSFNKKYIKGNMSDSAQDILKASIFESDGNGGIQITDETERLIDAYGIGDYIAMKGFQVIGSAGGFGLAVKGVRGAGGVYDLITNLYKKKKSGKGDDTKSERDDSSDVGDSAKKSDRWKDVAAGAGVGSVEVGGSVVKQIEEFAATPEARLNFINSDYGSGVIDALVDTGMSREEAESTAYKDAVRDAKREGFAIAAPVGALSGAGQMLFSPVLKSLGLSPESLAKTGIKSTPTNILTEGSLNAAEGVGTAYATGKGLENIDESKSASQGDLLAAGAESFVMGATATTATDTASSILGTASKSKAKNEESATDSDALPQINTEPFDLKYHTLGGVKSEAESAISFMEEQVGTYEDPKKQQEAADLIDRAKAALEEVNGIALDDSADLDKITETASDSQFDSLGDLQSIVNAKREILKSQQEPKSEALLDETKKDFDTFKKDLESKRDELSTKKRSISSSSDEHKSLSDRIAAIDDALGDLPDSRFEGATTVERMIEVSDDRLVSKINKAIDAAYAETPVADNSFKPDDTDVYRNAVSNGMPKEDAASATTDIANSLENLSQFGGIPREQFSIVTGSEPETPVDQVMSVANARNLTENMDLVEGATVQQKESVEKAYKVRKLVSDVVTTVQNISERVKKPKGSNPLFNLSGKKEAENIKASLEQVISIYESQGKEAPNSITSMYDRVSSFVSGKNPDKKFGTTFNLKDQADILQTLEAEVSSDRYRLNQVDRKNVAKIVEQTRGVDFDAERIEFAKREEERLNREIEEEKQKSLEESLAQQKQEELDAQRQKALEAQERQNKREAEKKESRTRLLDEKTLNDAIELVGSVVNDPYSPYTNDVKTNATHKELAYIAGVLDEQIQSMGEPTKKSEISKKRSFEAQRDMINDYLEDSDRLTDEESVYVESLAIESMQDQMSGDKENAQKLSGGKHNSVRGMAFTVNKDLELGDSVLPAGRYRVATKQIDGFINLDVIDVNGDKQRSAAIPQSEGAALSKEIAKNPWFIDSTKISSGLRGVIEESGGNAVFDLPRKTGSLVKGRYSVYTNDNDGYDAVLMERGSDGVYTESETRVLIAEGSSLAGQLSQLTPVNSNTTEEPKTKKATESKADSEDDMAEKSGGAKKDDEPTQSNDTKNQKEGDGQVDGAVKVESYDAPKSDANTEKSKAKSNTDGGYDISGLKYLIDNVASVGHAIAEVGETPEGLVRKLLNISSDTDVQDGDSVVYLGRVGKGDEHKFGLSRLVDGEEVIVHERKARIDQELIDGSKELTRNTRPFVSSMSEIFNVKDSEGREINKIDEDTNIHGRTAEGHSKNVSELAESYDEKSNEVVELITRINKASEGLTRKSLDEFIGNNELSVTIKNPFDSEVVIGETLEQPEIRIGSEESITMRVVNSTVGTNKKPRLWLDMPPEQTGGVKEFSKPVKLGDNEKGTMASGHKAIASMIDPESVEAIIEKLEAKAKEQKEAKEKQEKARKEDDEKFSIHDASESVIEIPTVRSEAVQILADNGARVFKRNGEGEGKKVESREEPRSIVIHVSGESGINAEVANGKGSVELRPGFYVFKSDERGNLSGVNGYPVVSRKKDGELHVSEATPQLNLDKGLALLREALGPRPSVRIVELDEYNDAKAEADKALAEKENAQAEKDQAVDDVLNTLKESGKGNGSKNTKESRPKGKEEEGKASFSPSFESSNVHIEESLPAKIAEFSSKLISESGIEGMKLSMVKDSSIKNGDIRLDGKYKGVAKDKLNGETLARITKVSDGEYVIVLGDRLFTDKGNLSQALAVEVIAHEIGHMHKYEAFDSADKETRDEIMSDYDEWKSKVMDMTVGEFLTSGKTPKAANSLKASGKNLLNKKMSELPPAVQDMLVSFDEFYSDQLAKWALTDKEPMSLVEKFFKRVADGLKSIFSKSSIDDYRPYKSITDFIHSLRVDDSKGKDNNDELYSDSNSANLSDDLGYNPLDDFDSYDDYSFNDIDFSNVDENNSDYSISMAESESDIRAMKLSTEGLMALPDESRDKIIKFVNDRRSGVFKKSFEYAEQKNGEDSMLSNAEVALAHAVANNLIPPHIESRLGSFIKEGLKEQNYTIDSDYDFRADLASIAESIGFENKYQGQVLTRAQAFDSDGYLRKEVLFDSDGIPRDVEVLGMTPEQLARESIRSQLKHAKDSLKAEDPESLGLIEKAYRKLVPYRIRNSVSKTVDSTAPLDILLEKYANNNPEDGELFKQYKIVSDKISEERNRIINLNKDTVERIHALEDSRREDFEKLTSLTSYWRIRPGVKNKRFVNKPTDALIKEKEALEEKIEKNLYMDEKAVRRAKSRIQNINADIAYNNDRLEVMKEIDLIWRGLDQSTKDLYDEVTELFENQAYQTFSALKDVAKGDKDTIAEIEKQEKRFRELLDNGPYIPLTRNGSFVVTGRLDDDRPFRVHFETLEEAEAYKQELSERIDVSEVKSFSMAEDEDGGEFGTILSSEMLKRFESSLEKSGSMSEKDIKKSKDALKRVMIQMMPEASPIKRQLDRKYVLGADDGKMGEEGMTDVLQVLASSIQSHASRLPKIEYGSRANDIMWRLKSSIEDKEGENSADRKRLYEVLRKRHSLIMNPNKSNKLSSGITQASFVYGLGANISSALMNATQVPLMALPYMSAEYGIGKSGAELMATLRDMTVDHKNVNLGAFKDIATGGDMGALIMLSNDSKGLSFNEKAMIQELMEEGKIQTTQASSIASISDVDQHESGVSKKSIKDRGIAATALLFHSAEVANRQGVALATYRLEIKKLKEKGVTGRDAHRMAVDKAVEMNEKVNFNYETYNRPPVMQNNLGKALLVFQYYAVAMAHRLIPVHAKAVKDTLKLKGVTGDATYEQKVAAVQTGAAIALGGAMAVPFVGLYGLAVSPLLGLFSGDEEESIEDFYSDEWRFRSLAKNILIDQFGLGDDDAEFYSEVVTRGIVNATTESNLSSKIELPFPVIDLGKIASASESENPVEDVVTEIFVQILGAPASMGANVAKGFIAAGRSAYNGYVTPEDEKAMVRAAPVFIQNAINSRIDSEGLTNKEGRVMLDENGNPIKLTDSQEIGYAFGFQPTQKHEIYLRKSNAYRVERERRKRENQIFKDYYNGVEERGYRLSDHPEIVSRIRAHNKLFPDNPISYQTIGRKVKNERKKDNDNQWGTTNKSDTFNRALGNSFPSGDKEPVVDNYNRKPNNAANINSELDKSPKEQSTQKESQNNDYIDYQLLKNEEGFETTGYVPKKSNGKYYLNSGVTIGYGVDLGSKTRGDFEKAGVPDEIIDKLEPFFKLKGLKAVDAAGDLSLTKEEAEILSRRVKDVFIKEVEAKFNRDSKTKTKFDDLTMQQRTVLTSIAYQYGVDGLDLFRFYDSVLEGKWDKGIKQLRKVKEFNERRNREADYLEMASL